MSPHLSRRVLLVLASAVVSAGCSDGRLPTYPVSGQVIFEDGSPVHVGTVELKSREHNIHARGEIGTDGRFSLSTYESGDGAVAGKHDCVVVQMVMVEEISGFRHSTDGVVHPRFGSYRTSELLADVAEKRTNELKITVGRLSDRPTHSAGEHAHDHQPSHNNPHR
jgi:hypothetical protein